MTAPHGVQHPAGFPSTSTIGTRSGPEAQTSEMNAGLTVIQDRTRSAIDLPGSWFICYRPPPPVLGTEALKVVLPVMDFANACKLVFAGSNVTTTSCFATSAFIDL